MYVVIFIFLGLEMSVRIFFPHFDIVNMKVSNPNETAVGWSLTDAYSAYTARPGTYDERKTVNNQGFVSTPEISLHKSSEVLRIVFLGGSSTTGMMLSDEETWPWLVTDMLREKFPHQEFEFINASLPGYTTFDSYGRLWSRLRFYEPDVIVMYHGWNEMYYFNKDVADNIHKLRVLSDGSWSSGEHVETNVRQYEPLPIDPYIQHSQLLTLIRTHFSTPLEWGEIAVRKGLADSYDKRGLDIFRTNLRLIRAAADLFDAELFVVKQATLISERSSVEVLKNAKCEYHGFTCEAHLRAFRDIYKVIEEEIESDKIIDATPLSGESAYFHDHIHLKEEGARKLAETIAENLSKQLQL